MLYIKIGVFNYKQRTVVYETLIQKKKNVDRIKSLQLIFKQYIQSNLKNCIYSPFLFLNSSTLFIYYQVRFIFPTLVLKCCFLFGPPFISFSAKKTPAFNRCVYAVTLSLQICFKLDHVPISKTDFTSLFEGKFCPWKCTFRRWLAINFDLFGDFFFIMTGKVI